LAKLIHESQFRIWFEFGLIFHYINGAYTNYVNRKRNSSGHLFQRKADRDDRDLLVFSVWKTGILTNEKIGRLFGMTYSSISHIVRSVRLRMEKNRRLKEKFNQIYSLFKI